jgi:hypothetical protein
MKDVIETYYSIFTEKQLEEIKKPKISFYSPKKTIQSLLALPEVKEDMRPLLKKGKRVEITRYGDRFDCRVYGLNERSELFNGKSLGECISETPDKKSKGLKMLNRGLSQMKYERADYNWTWIPPVAGIIIGGAVGTAVGHYTEVFAGGTAGSIERAEIIDGLIGSGIGGGSGLLLDVAVAGAKAVKDILEEPINRIKLADKIKKSVSED